jgi:hypothetical protein
MPSINTSRSQIAPNKLYINVAGIQSTIFDAAGNKAGWVAGVGALSTAGAAVLRDMGKNVYLPDPTVNNPAVGSQSTILRKVQLVPSGAAGYYGTGAPAGVAPTAGTPGSTTEYYTGYIALGGQTYGGGNGIPTAVARLN